MVKLFFNLKVFEKRIPCISCLIAVCLLLFLGSCSEQAEEFEVPETLDDAALVEAQLNQLHRTRANDAYSTVLITTAKSVNFQVAKTGRILVDWGDGNQEYDVFSHTYTDNFPAHTICFYDPDTTITELTVISSQLIFLDIAKNTNLKKLYCFSNRLSTLDISNNLDLEELYCMANGFKNLDFSGSKALKILSCQSCSLSSLSVKGCVNLEKLYCGGNQLSSLDLFTHTKLEYLSCDNNKLSSLDLSTCLALSNLQCSYNQINDLKISNQSALQYIYCKNNPFESANNAVLSFIQGLPNRTGKDKGVLSFSLAINDSGCLSTVQTFCTIFNWELSYN